MSADIKSATTAERCEECGAGAGQHGWWCMRQTVKQAVESCRRMSIAREQSCTRLTAGIQHLTAQVTLWQGKFRIVAHENNVLRKKLRKQ